MKEWIRYMGKETLPRKTNHLWEKKRRREEEKCIDSRRIRVLSSGKAHLKSTNH